MTVLDDGLDAIYGPAPTPVSSVRYDPAQLIEAMAPLGLRQVAVKLGVDPAILCRQWSARQADKYATRLELHPGEVWGLRWWRPELFVEGAVTASST